MKRWLRRGLKGISALLLAIGALLVWNLRPPAVGEPAPFPPAADAIPPPPQRLRVVTWNVWGLWLLTPRREERLAAVAHESVGLRPDLIGFQEAFVEADREKLRAALGEAGLKHSRYFPSGLVGSGLFLVSRFPIESDGYIRFRSNGHPHALHHGDWWAGKGLSLSRIRLPDGTPLHLGNTHFHARYGGTAYHHTQLAQAGQLIPWIEKVRATGAPSLWLGDWNSEPGSDVLAPLVEAGGWRLLTTREPRIDHVFGGGEGWQWRAIAQGKRNGFLEGEPKTPWSDHAARWVEVELQRQAP